MSVALCLLLYAATVSLVAPRLLPRLTRHGNAPRAAVAAWLIVLASVMAASAAAVTVFAVDAARTWIQPGPRAIGACIALIRAAATGHHGPLLQAGLLTATAVVLAAAAVLVARIGRSMMRARARAREHARSAHIVGRHVDGVDGLVVDTPQKMAYCVGGRPGTIVITSAAVATLERPQLDAVLAHEQAHLAGRHHQLLMVLRSIAVSLPRIRLFTVAHAEVARLLEMCADDAAARHHGAAALLAAILALAGADPVAFPALGATTIGVCARVTRLAVPDSAALRIRSHLLLATFTGAVVVGPLAVWAAVYGLTACGPFGA